MNGETEAVWRQILERHGEELGLCKDWALSDEDGTEVADLYRDLISPEAMQIASRDDDRLALICRLAVVGIGAAAKAASDTKDAR